MWDPRTGDEATSRMRLALDWASVPESRPSDDYAQSVKQRFLVCYDYGMGGRWGYVLAESREDVAAKFPELAIIDDEPSWMTDEDRAEFERDEEDIDSAKPPSILTTILIERKRSS